MEVIKVARRRKPKTLICLILGMIFWPMAGFFKYVMNFKPTPIVGRSRRRRKRRW
jgi:hypothetical protein